MYNPKLLPDIGTGASDISNDKSPSAPQATVALSPQAPPQILSDAKPVGVNTPIDENIGKVYRLRKEILRSAKAGKIKPEVVSAIIEKAGIKNPATIETLVSSQLNDNIIRYFLNATKNDPKKAKTLAKKFGFKV